MQYVPFGETGWEISRLGFGAMRLPTTLVDDQPVPDEEASIAMMHRAFAGGVNYIDTAYMYCQGRSEVIVGKALAAGWRDRVKLSTKLPLHKVECRDDFRRLLDEQLGKLATDRIDFYHFHGLKRERWQDKVLAFDLLEEMERAKQEGLIAHASFSFHDDPENMRIFIDSGAFASVLCQYNLLDRSNQAVMHYARERGMGVVVMGPVGGGRLGSPADYLEEAVPGRIRTPELALRFVLSNPDVCCALSGMSSLQQVEENLVTAADDSPLGADELAAVERALAERKGLADLYCTGCGYCMPCPQEVNIPVCFECMIDHTVYGFTDRAMQRYRAVGDRWLPGKRADGCIGCGECEPKCPQNIPIRKQLAEVAAELGPRLDGDA